MMFLCSVASTMSSYDSCLSVHFLRINTVVILLGDVIRDNPWVIQAEMERCKVERSLWEPEVWNVKMFTELLSMEGKYAVKLSISDPIKISRK